MRLYMKKFKRVLLVLVLLDMIQHYENVCYNKKEDWRKMMQTLIDRLKNALTEPDRFLMNLRSEGEYYFSVDYPVAVVHHQKRIKEADMAECLNNEGFLDAYGYTPGTYDEEMISAFSSCASKYVKKVSLMCFSSEAEGRYIFQEKRTGDYWKKILDPGNFEAVIEYSEFKSGEDICKIEFELRELMRSSKEVPSLKVLPYVWVARVSKDVDISKIMQHYCGENFVLMEGDDESIAIGWSDTLQGVNMRYFVCPPS